MGTKDSAGEIVPRGTLCLVAGYVSRETLESIPCAGYSTRELEYLTSVPRETVKLAVEWM